MGHERLMNICCNYDTTGINDITMIQNSSFDMAKFNI